jgi:hypothetical protein
MYDGNVTEMAAENGELVRVVWWKWFSSHNEIYYTL